MANRRYIVLHSTLYKIYAKNVIYCFTTDWLCVEEVARSHSDTFVR